MLPHLLLVFFIRPQSVCGVRGPQNFMTASPLSRASLARSRNFTRCRAASRGSVARQETRYLALDSMAFWSKSAGGIFAWYDARDRFLEIPHGFEHCSVQIVGRTTTQAETNISFRVPPALITGSTMRETWGKWSIRSPSFGHCARCLRERSWILSKG